MVNVGFTLAGKSTMLAGDCALTIGAKEYCCRGMTNDVLI